MTDLPSRARLLGFAGLLPFLAAVLLLWTVEGRLAGLAARSLLAYGAVILSFMGAVHWGLAMAKDRPGATGQLTLSVLPGLAGWVALLLPARPGCALLAFGFALLYLADRRAATAGAVPAWYPGLRLPLTLGVLASLGLGFVRV